MTTALRQILADYLRIRRTLGFKLAREEKLIGQFLDYLECHRGTCVTVEMAVAWARLPANPSPRWLGYRISTIRSFAAFANTLDPIHQVIPRGVLSCRATRATPYLYSDQDIALLVEATGRLRYPVGRISYPVLIQLLAVTGLRIGEALALDDSDLDVEHGVLTVRDGKFGKSRLVPLDPSVTDALRAYQQQRDQVVERAEPGAFFLASTGRRLAYVNVSQIFVKLVRRTGLADRSANCHPRPHDLRHTFAVRTLIDWYADGGDVQARLPLLSTYLGHTEPKHTYWYLQAAPELMALAADRLHARMQEVR